MQIIPIPAAQPAFTAVSPRRLYFAEDEQTVVEEGDTKAAFLAVGAGCETSDPRVLKHLDVTPPEGAAVATVAVSKPVEKEQSPTRVQIELEANSPTAASIPEVVAIEKKEAAGTATGPVEEAKADLPQENRSGLEADKETPEAEGANPSEAPKAAAKPKTTKAKAVKPAENKAVTAPEGDKDAPKAEG